MKVTIANLKKELHSLGIKTYLNKKTNSSFVRLEDIKKIVAEEKSGLLVHFNSNSDITKAEKIINKSDYTVADKYELTLEFDEENPDFLEKELDKLFYKNGIENYYFEAF